MLRYIVRRILFFIPTLIAISLFAFTINVIAPGDPIDRLVSSAYDGRKAGTKSGSLKKQKKLWSEKLGLDLPLFYLSITSLSFPDTLFRIYDKDERYVLARMIDQYGNWNEIQAYYKSLLRLNDFNNNLLLKRGNSQSEEKEAVDLASIEAVSLLSLHQEKIIEIKLEKIAKVYGNHPAFNEGKEILLEVKNAHKTVKANTKLWKNYIPKINFNLNNQYHRWIFGDGNWLTGGGHTFTKGIIRGDFGISYVTKPPISDKIGERIFWSLVLAIISVVLAYLISIPIGIMAAARKDSIFDKVSGIIVFILYSMPSFWVAVLLLMVFSNPGNFADNIALLPASGVKPVTGYPVDAGILEKVSLSVPYLILPVICYTYGSFAFLSRTMRATMLEVINQDYIRTARAKGLYEAKVLYKHGLKNALLPIITVFANVFPFVIGGSVILESIFGIPGMGNEIFTAIHQQDYPMIIAVFTLTGLLTMVGFLVSDILYTVVDPRISYSKN